MLWWYFYLSVLPLSALVIFFYPLLRRKTLPLSRSLRHSAVISLILLILGHLTLCAVAGYLMLHGYSAADSTPPEFIFVLIAFSFVICGVMLVGIFGCIRAILRKLIPQ